jgi:hypothetical protein
LSPLPLLSRERVMIYISISLESSSAFIVNNHFYNDYICQELFKLLYSFFLPILQIVELRN